MVRAGLVVVLLAGALAPAAAPPPREQWIAVVAPAFGHAVRPLADHRRAQGMRVIVVTTTDLAPADAIWSGKAGRLHDRVRQLVRDHPGPSRVVLVGAVSAGTPEATAQTVVPPFTGTAGRMRGQPTDNPLGCLDGTRLPTVPVGRLPARTVAEAEAMVAKTLAYERQPRGGDWSRRLTILAGIPAYNPVVDRMLESAAFARFDRLNPVWTGRAVYTNPNSRFALPDRLIRPLALDYLRDGQAVVLYLGHSDASGLYAGPTAEFLSRADWRTLRVGAPGSVFLTFGCNGCQLAGRDGEGYGVWALRNPRGPAAVVGSHGVCYAAMVQLATDGLFQKAFAGRPARTVGDLWLAALAGVAHGPIDFVSYRLLDAVDGDPSSPQAAQRQEHLEMFVLLGDPALRLPAVGDDLTLQPSSRTVTPGGVLEVCGQLPPYLHSARVQVWLNRTPGSVPVDLEPVPATPGPARDRVLLANHRRANEFTVTQADDVAVQGRFTVQLKVPPRLPGTRLLLRVRAFTADAEAITAEPLTVSRPAD